MVHGLILPIIFTKFQFFSIFIPKSRWQSIFYEYMYEELKYGGKDENGLKLKTRNKCFWNKRDEF